MSKLLKMKIKVAFCDKLETKWIFLNFDPTKSMNDISSLAEMCGTSNKMEKRVFLWNKKTNRRKKQTEKKKWKGDTKQLKKKKKES